MLLAEILCQLVVPGDFNRTGSVGAHDQVEQANRQQDVGIGRDYEHDRSVHSVVVQQSTNEIVNHRMPSATDLV